MEIKILQMRESKEYLFRVYIAKAPPTIMCLAETLPHKYIGCDTKAGREWERFIVKKRESFRYALLESIDLGKLQAGN